MNQLSESQMKEVLRRTVDALRKLNELWGLDDPVSPRPPATQLALRKLAATVPFPLPPSYVQLLCIHDGIDNFYGIRGQLLPSSYRLDFPNFERDWNRPHLLFFVEDDDFNAVAFDTNMRNPECEMEVVEIAENIDSDRWPSLSDFLIGYMERIENWLANEQADRSVADDD